MKTSDTIKEVELLTVKDLAKILKLTSRKVYHMTAKKDISFIQVGGAIRFHPKTVEKFLIDNTIKSSSQG